MARQHFLKTWTILNGSKPSGWGILSLVAENEFLLSSEDPVYALYEDWDLTYLGTPFEGLKVEGIINVSIQDYNGYSVSVFGKVLDPTTLESPLKIEIVFDSTLNPIIVVLEQSVEIDGSAIGDLQYTEENYVSSEQSLTSSIDALDKAIATKLTLDPLTNLGDILTLVSANVAGTSLMAQTTGLVTIRGNLSVDTSITFTGASLGGILRYNSYYGGLEFTMGFDGIIAQFPYETYYPPVLNHTAEDFYNGMICMVDPSVPVQGQRLSVIPAIGDGSLSADLVTGMLTMDILKNTMGLATKFGEVHDLNITTLETVSLKDPLETWEIGQMLYLSPTLPGGLTNILPQAPNLAIKCAVILNKSGVNLDLMTRFESTFSLNELHDVSRYDKNTLVNGSILSWNSTDKYWETIELGTIILDTTGDLFAEKNHTHAHNDTTDLNTGDYIHLTQSEYATLLEYISIHQRESTGILITGTTTIAVMNTTNRFAAVVDYSIISVFTEKTLTAGSHYVAWDDTNVVYSDTTTADLAASTSTIVLDYIKSGSDVLFRATISSGQFKVKCNIKYII